MRTSLRWTIIILLLAAAAAPAAEGAKSQPSPRTGNATLLLGSRWLEDDDLWYPADTVDSIAIEMDWGRKSWPIHILAGIEMGKESKEGWIPEPSTGEVKFSDVHTQLFTVSVGIQAYFRTEKKLQPFVGGALAMTFAERDLRGLAYDPVEEEDSVGLLGKAGVRVRVAKNLYVGAEGRTLLGTDVELFKVKGNADFVGASVLLSWGW